MVRMLPGRYGAGGAAWLGWIDFFFVSLFLMLRLLCWYILK